MVAVVGQRIVVAGLKLMGQVVTDVVLYLLLTPIAVTLEAPRKDQGQKTQDIPNMAILIGKTGKTTRTH